MIYAELKKQGTTASKMLTFKGRSRTKRASKINQITWTSLSVWEFEEALTTLKAKKSPGPDKVTNKMLGHLGSKAKSKLLALFNNSWKTGHVLVPIHKRGRTEWMQTTTRRCSSEQRGSIYIQYPGGRENRICFATGLYSLNYKAEAEALKAAAAHIENSPHSSRSVVFLTDALSVLQALQSGNNTKLNDLSSVLTSLCTSHAVILQWIPSHCDLHGNETANSLAEEGSHKEQTHRSTSYTEAKIIIWAEQLRQWHQQHPRYNSSDPFHLLPRRQQVTIFRLRTGHNRLNHHLFTKFHICQTKNYPCQTGSQKTEHLLQSCHLHEALRQRIRLDHKAMVQKL